MIPFWSMEGTSSHVTLIAVEDGELVTILIGGLAGAVDMNDINLCVHMHTLQIITYQLPGFDYQ